MHLINFITTAKWMGILERIQGFVEFRIPGNWHFVHLSNGLITRFSHSFHVQTPQNDAFFSLKAGIKSNHLQHEHFIRDLQVSNVGMFFFLLWNKNTDIDVNHKL